MKTLIALCASLTLNAEDILITRLKPFIINPRAEERPDWKKFKIEVFSRSGTNWIKFEKDNILVPIEDFKDVPDGPAILVQKTIFSDGDESDAIAIDVAIYRKRPAPGVKSTAPLTEEEAKAKTFDDLMFIKKRERATRPAPAPSGAVIVVAHPTPPPPMVDATNRPYSNHLRRNE